MKAIALKRPGSLQDLGIQELEKPVPGPGQALVKMHAASLNPVDYKTILSGVATWKYPHIPGVDGAGTIEAIDTTCPEHLYPGLAVAFHADLRFPGTFAEYILVPWHTLAPIPEGLDMVQASALPCAGLTAYQALFERCNVQSHHTVLVSGAAGGVGSLAVQLAKLRGARVVGTCSPENDEFVRSMGADHTFDYHTQSLREGISEFTQGRGADIIIDGVSGHSATQSLNALCYGGQLVCLSGLPDISKIHQFTTALSVHEVALGAAYGHGTRLDQERMAQNLVLLMSMAHEGKLRVPVGKVIGLDEVINSLEELRERHVRGKIVLSFA